MPDGHITNEQLRQADRRAICFGPYLTMYSAGCSGVRSLSGIVIPVITRYIAHVTPYPRDLEESDGACRGSKMTADLARSDSVLHSTTEQPPISQATSH